MTPITDITPKDILRFWFEDLSPGDHFNASNAVDATITARFGTLVEGLEAAGYPHIWEGEPESALALVLALDQFPRNIYRGQAGAFLLDTLGLDVAQRAIGRGFHKKVGDRAKWFLMPLMHSENLAVQDASLPLFAEYSDSDTLAHAKAHRDQIDRFGRFPARNAALYRDTTGAEQDYLDNGGYAAALKAYQS